MKPPTVTVFVFEEDLAELILLVHRDVLGLFHVHELAKALGASKVVSTAGSKAKAEQARERGYDNVVDLSAESLALGVRRLTDGAGIDVVIDAIGGTITSEALKAMAMGGSLVTLGYSAGRNTTIDVTDIIWKDLSVTGFSLFRSTRQEIQAAWDVISPLLVKGLGQYAKNRPRSALKKTVPQTIGTH